MKRLAIVVLAVAACGGSDGGSPADYYTIPLTTANQEFWSPKVTIGGQTFAMDLDTGSTTTAIAGTTCSTCTNVSPEYMPGSTAMDEGKTAESEYADGTGWQGEVYQDTIMVGSDTPEATFALVDISTQVVNGGQSGFFDNSNAYQGILGMGAPQNAVNNTGAYFQTLVGSDGVKPVMAFELCPDGGTMWLGGYDDTHASAAVQYTPMVTINNANPFYSINVTSMAIGNTNVGTGADEFEEPVIDTGTTFFYVPTSVQSAVISAVNASSGFQALFPGTTLQNDPSFSGVGCTNTSSVTDAQVDAMLPPLNIVMPGVNNGASVTFQIPALESYMFDASQGVFCLGIEDGGSQDASTFGDQFMQAFVSVIDTGNNQIGFALDKGCGSGSGVSHRRAPRDLATLHPHLPKRGKFASAH
jgi:Eukaryotic aspartyl protease